MTMLVALVALAAGLVDENASHSLADPPPPRALSRAPLAAAAKPQTLDRSVA